MVGSWSSFAAVTMEKFLEGFEFILLWKDERFLSLIDRLHNSLTICRSGLLIFSMQQNNHGWHTTTTKQMTLVQQNSACLREDVLPQSVAIWFAWRVNPRHLYLPLALWPMKWAIRCTVEESFSFINQHVTRLYKQGNGLVLTGCVRHIAHS